MANKAEKEPSLKIALDYEGKEVAQSLLSVTKHLMVFPPAYTTDDYNLGVQLLFDIIRASLDMNDEGRVWETGIM